MAECELHRRICPPTLHRRKLARFPAALPHLLAACRLQRPDVPRFLPHAARDFHRCSTALGRGCAPSPCPSHPLYAPPPPRSEYPCACRAAPPPEVGRQQRAPQRGPQHPIVPACQRSTASRLSQSPP